MTGAGHRDVAGRCSHHGGEEILNLSGRRGSADHDTSGPSGQASPATRPVASSDWQALSTRQQRNIAIRRAYVSCADTAGPPLAPGRPDQPVAFRTTLSAGARVVLTLFVLVNCAATLCFIGWLLLPDHVPGAAVASIDGWRLAVSRASYCLVILVELVRLGQSVTVWVFAFFAKDPVPVDPPIGFKVALLTTIVPEKEPIEIAERTLRKLKEVLYAGTVDVWILDEGDDPRVRAMAERIGVRHFSRKGRPEYNQPSGEFRARTKAGNHNSWRVEHEHEYDVVANVDPDHVPMPSFLERTLGYFRDPDVAFVVTPQVYGNMFQNWVAHGAAVQQYLYNGVIARGGNGLDAPLLTGTGHLYRPEAWRQIGGYQDSIIEDHVTSIRVHSTVNPATGNYWKGVYTPDVVAVGEGPTSWADYFNQQKRWAYGIWEILLTARLHRSQSLPRPRRWQYRLLQFYYPSVALSLMLGNVATAVYLLTGINSMRVDPVRWLGLWAATLVTWFVLLLWLRRYNVAPHEREEVGMTGMGLALFAGPIYVAAGMAALLRRRLAFVVTAKGKLRSAESLKTFRLHLLWAAAAAILLWLSYARGHDYALLRVWATLTLLTGGVPPLLAALSGLLSGRQREADPVEAIIHPHPDDPTAVLPAIRVRPAMVVPPPSSDADTVMMPAIDDMARPRA